jgi:hypothetical protein
MTRNIFSRINSSARPLTPPPSNLNDDQPNIELCYQAFRNTNQVTRLSKAVELLGDHDFEWSHTRSLVACRMHQLLMT